MYINHIVGKAIELRETEGTEPLWRYSYGERPKPFFHPLRTPAGFCLSLFEPHDHFWHRGLWFTIKFINGENFWEEVGDFGSQRSLLPPTITHLPNGAVTIAHDQVWERPCNAGAVFAEHRKVTYRSIGETAYVLDWDIALVAQADLLLDRTPFTTWGGYGGLTVRGNRNWQNTRLLFPDGSTSERPIGIPANWCDLSGKLDGGDNKFGGVAMFDHPDNVRHPSPWYGATGSGHYFNAAFLFHEPLRVAAGDVLNFKYRVLIHDDEWEHDRLTAAYDDYLTEAAS